MQEDHHVPIDIDLSEPERLLAGATISSVDGGQRYYIHLDISFANSDGYGTGYLRCGNFVSYSCADDGFYLGREAAEKVLDKYLFGDRNNLIIFKRDGKIIREATNAESKIHR